MTVIYKHLKIKTTKENDIINITAQISKALKECNIKNGIVTIFVIGSTAAITTIEYEPGLKNDFSKMLSRIAPKDIGYDHDSAWHDGNGHSHVRASLLGPSLTIPYIEDQLMIGTWQQIVLIEMDTRPRERTIIVLIIGE